MNNAAHAVQAMSASPDVMLAMSAPTRWQTVMFDPLAYIHPARLALPATFDAPAQRAAINRFLIERFRLDLRNCGNPRIGGPKPKRCCSSIGCICRKLYFCLAASACGWLWPGAAPS